MCDICLLIHAFLVFRYGRVNYVLAKRIELLESVQRLQESLGGQGDVGATCETAAHFFLYHIVARWEKFLSVCKPKSSKAKVWYFLCGSFVVC